MGFLFFHVSLLWAPACTFNVSGVASGAEAGPLDDAASITDGQVMGDASADGAPGPDGSSADSAAGPDAYVEPDASPVDSDGDGVPDTTDNCVDIPNTGQHDFDGDGEGDLCDSDADGDLIPEVHDPDDLDPHDLLYYNDFSTELDDFAEEGTWTHQGGSLCQTDTYPLWPRMRLEDVHLPASDMVVETLMTVTDADLGHSDWASAGVGVRSLSVGPGNYHSYLCCLDLDHGRLVLLQSIGSYVDELDATGSGTVPTTGSFTIRARAEGTTIECELLPAGTANPLIVQSSALSSGTAGFFTYRAAACWDYLLVYVP
jgi:hypothetical protein